MTKSMPKEHMFTIIIVNDVAHVNGGVSQVALSDANYLSNKGYNIIFFSATPRDKKDLGLSSKIQFIDTGQHELIRDKNFIRAAAQGIWNLKAKKKFLELLELHDRKSTLIHIHGWSKSLSSSVTRAAIDSGFAIVNSLYDYFLACPNGGFYNFPQKKICQLAPLSKSCIFENCDSRSYGHKVWRLARHVVQDKFGGMPNEIKNFIACSNLSLEIMRPFLPIDSKIFHVPNPISAEKRIISACSESSSYAFAGRLSPEKGPLLLAQAAFFSKIPVTFIGDGICHNEILKIYPEAEITGWVSNHRAREILSTARALVFPSVWQEVQGLVVLEAAALGVPSIVPDTAATREMVIDGETGLWFKGGDLYDLTNKINKLKDSTLVQKLGKNAYERFWASPPTERERIKTLEECYLKIMHDHSCS